MKIYSIFDRAAHSFGNLLLQNNDALLKRNLKSAIKNKALGPEILAYPQDFEVYCLGDFDNDEGGIRYEKTFVVNISDLIPVEEEKKDA